MQSIKGFAPVTTHVSSQTAKAATAVNDLAAFNAGAAEFRIPAVLSEAQRSSGLQLNRIENVMLSGNMHFGGWQDVIPKDTEVVIVSGAAYRGKTVKLGWETFKDAEIVYAKRNSGLSNVTYLDVPGLKDEAVRILYARVAPGAQFANDGETTTVSNCGQSAGIGGDPYRRDVHLDIVPTEGLAAETSSEQFTHYLDDGYGWGVQGAYNLALGGGASPKYLLNADGSKRKAHEIVVMPMQCPNAASMDALYLTPRAE